MKYSSTSKMRVRNARAWARRIAVILVVLVGAARGGSALACPMCSESLSNSDTTPAVNGGVTPQPSGDLASGFYYSILLMLAVPFSLMGGLGGVLYMNLRKPQANQPLRGSSQADAKTQ